MSKFIAFYRSTIIGYQFFLPVFLVQLFSFALLHRILS